MRPREVDSAATALVAAVGGLVGLPAQSVMQGQPKTPMNCCVVSKDKLVGLRAVRMAPGAEVQSKRDRDACRVQKLARLARMNPAPAHGPRTNLKFELPSGFDETLCQMVSHTCSVSMTLANSSTRKPSGYSVPRGELA